MKDNKCGFLSGKGMVTASLVILEGKHIFSGYGSPIPLFWNALPRAAGLFGNTPCTIEPYQHKGRPKVWRAAVMSPNSCHVIQ